MADLKITSKITATKVLDFLTAVWPELAQKLNGVEDAQNKAELRNDYAKALEFLTDKPKVIEGLRPLNKAIKEKLDEQILQELKTKVTSIIGQTGDAEYTAGSTTPGKPFKTYKVLSGLLDSYENSQGFNGAQTTLQKLHTTALTTGDPSMTNAVQFNQGEPAWTNHNPQGVTSATNLPTIALPKGAPTLGGILLKSFNPILLKNGYHWKDPGADAVIHGEFTHRLQWYAIGRAAAAGQLALVNTPVQIFKSMGYLFSRGTNDGEPVYLWELVCDNFAEARDRKAYKPYTGEKDCFSCPDYLQAYLSRATYMGNPAHELPYLNIFMRARYLMRAFEQSKDVMVADKIRAGTKKVGFGVSSDPTKLGDEPGAAIWWIIHS